MDFKNIVFDANTLASLEFIDRSQKALLKALLKAIRSVFLHVE